MENPDQIPVRGLAINISVNYGADKAASVSARLSSPLLYWNRWATLSRYITT